MGVLFGILAEKKEITCLVRISASYNELTLNDVQSKAEVVIIRLWLAIRSLSFWTA